MFNIVITIVACKLLPRTPNAEFRQRKILITSATCFAICDFIAAVVT